MYAWRVGNEQAGRGMEWSPTVFGGIWST